MAVHRVLGLDPGLQRTGWGVVECEGSVLRHVGHGVITSTAKLSLAERLVQLFEGVNAIVESHAPQTAAVELTFVNKDPKGTLKLGQARAICLLCPSLAGLPVAEYAPNLVKKSVVGSGHATKEQIRTMVEMLLPQSQVTESDAADALATAICHAHHMTAPGLQAVS